jgi:hypothetical protein
VKEFLSQHEVPYELRDVVRDAAARDEFLSQGWLLPPVTVVDGVAVAGYLPERLLDLLQLR